MLGKVFVKNLPFKCNYDGILGMNYLKKSTFVLLLIAIFFLQRSLAQEAEDKFTKADALYGQGDCKSAIVEYQNVLKQKNNLEDKKKILFRSSYCQYILGEFAKSEKGFETYLKKIPDHQEARVRYAQSLFFNGCTKGEETNSGKQ